MQILIDLDEDVYKRLFDNSFYGIAKDDVSKMDIAIRKGTILPKGHGRLIDADELRTKSIDVNAEFGNEWWCVDCDDIELAPTVLEADKKI